MRSCSLKLLECAHVVISIIRHAIRNLAGLERAAEVADSLRNAMLRCETEHARDLVGIDVVGPVIVSRSRNNLDWRPPRKLFFDHTLHQMGEVRNAHILIAAIEY